MNLKALFNMDTISVFEEIFEFPSIRPDDAVDEARTKVETYYHPWINTIISDPYYKKMWILSYKEYQEETKILPLKQLWVAISIIWPLFLGIVVFWFFRFMRVPCFLIPGVILSVIATLLLVYSKLMDDSVKNGFNLYFKNVESFRRALGVFWASEWHVWGSLWPRDD